MKTKLKISKVGQIGFSLVEKKDFYGAVRSGYVSSVNDEIQILGVRYILSSVEPNGSSMLSAILNLSDTTMFDVVTGILTIPPASSLDDIFNLRADLYAPAGVYKIGSIVRSDGTNGGVNKKCYKSITDGNSGNLLSDAANWVFADAAGGNVGKIEIASLVNLSADQVSAFREDGTFTTVYKSGGSTPGPGQFFLDLNTDVEISNPYSQMSFINISGVSVIQPAPKQ